MNFATTNPLSKKWFIYLVILGLLFTIVYVKLFHAGFISWDDAEYVLENKDVRTFHLSNLLTTFYVGNYHPLTLLNYALDWKLFGNHPFGYHLENLIWHFLNVWLVMILSQKIVGSRTKAGVVAIIFAFHPTQLESVAWIAERKTVLYAFFFLCALITYIRFIEKKELRFLTYTFVLFCASVLCKSSAIVFPFVLLCLDFFYRQPFSKTLLLQKIPFLLVSLAFGIITLFAQQAGKFINEHHAYSFFERIGYAGYAILHYVYKTLIPFNLSVIYPYPSHKLVSMVAGFVCIGTLMALLYKLYTSKKNMLFFGLTFFLINLLLVLQIIPFGEVLTADRYMYLPLLGISWALMALFPPKERIIAVTGMILLTVFGTMSFLRASVWVNSMGLYGDILKKYPHSSVALHSLGAEYLFRKNYTQAMNYFNKALSNDARNHKGYYNRGLLYAQTGKFNEALADFNKSIALAQYPKAYVARANVYYVLKAYDLSMADAKTVLSKDPDHVKALYVMGNCYDHLNQLDKALVFYNKAIAADPEESTYYLRRAVLNGKKQQFTVCIRDLDTCLKLNPNFAEAYYWKGVALFNLQQNPCSDFKKAVQLGFMEAQKPLSAYCQ